MPYSAALELPSSELAIWQEVFIQEYYEMHPEKKPKEKIDNRDVNQNIELIKSLLESKKNKIIDKSKNNQNNI